MPNYDYQALDKAGKDFFGSLEAETSGDLGAKLKEKELYLVKIVNNEKNIKGTKKTSLTELAVATRQLAILLQSGFPLTEAFSFLVEQFKNKQLGGIIEDIRQQVRSGSSFNQALSRYSKVFGPIYINMVRAGEIAGTLDSVLFRLAGLLENQIKLRGRLQVILTYPAIMVFVGTGVLFFLLMFVVPMVSKIFIQMDQSLPLPTVILMSVSLALKKFWWIILSLLTGIFFLFKVYIRKQKGKLFFDRLKLRVPVISDLFIKGSIINFSRVLSTLLDSGVEILAALDIAKNTADNQVISSAISSSKDLVSKGSSVSSSLEKSGVFPTMFIRMVAAGEKSGQIQNLLSKSADIYENELTTSLNRFVAMLEPGVILIMGLVVGFIVLAILLPILEMSQLVG